MTLETTRWSNQEHQRRTCDKYASPYAWCQCMHLEVWKAISVWKPPPNKQIIHSVPWTCKSSFFRPENGEAKLKVHWSSVTVLYSYFERLHSLISWTFTVNRWGVNHSSFSGGLHSRHDVMEWEEGQLTQLYIIYCSFKFISLAGSH